MKKIIRKAILTAFVVAAMAISSQAGRMPPAVDTLTYNKKTVTVTKATFTLSSAAGELLDVEKFVLADGITPDRLNLSAAVGSIIHVGPNAFDEYKPGKMQFGGDGWYLVDGGSLPVGPMYYGGNFWVTNDTTVGWYIGLSSAYQTDIRVEKGCTLTMNNGGGIRLQNGNLTFSGGGTLALSGSKGSSAFSTDEANNRYRFIVEEGVVDFTGMTSNYFLNDDTSHNWDATLEVREDAVLKFGNAFVDFHNLLLCGARIESTCTVTTRDNYTSALILAGNLTVLPSATPTVIDAANFSLSWGSDFTNRVNVAAGASLELTGLLKPGSKDKKLLPTSRVLVSGAGEVKFGDVHPNVTVLQPTLFNEAAVWIDANDVIGYADGENVNVVTNKGTAGGVFKNFVAKEVGTGPSSTSPLKYNGQLPGPEYRADGINGHPAFRFSLTNALYTTAYENIGGEEMTVFCVSAYLPTTCVNGKTNATITSTYGLVDMTYEWSPLNNYSTNRLIVGSTFANFSRSDTVSAKQFAGGAVSEPRVSVASRQGPDGYFKMFGTDAQGVSSGSKTPMTLNFSNRIDRIVLGGYLSSALKNGPYCSTKEDFPEPGMRDIDYTYNQRMASGVLGEYIVFDRKLTADEEEVVTTYLRRKWLSSEATKPFVTKTTSSFTVTTAAGTTNDFSAPVAVSCPYVDLAGQGTVAVPQIEKAGSGALAFGSAAQTAPLAVKVDEGELIFSRQLSEHSTLEAADGTRIVSSLAGPLALDTLTLGDGVTLVRQVASRDAATYKMFGVTGRLVLGADPVLIVNRTPQGVADVITYGELSAADPLSWTVKRENGKVYGMIDDREGHAFRFDPSTGMLLIFR